MQHKTNDLARFLEIKYRYWRLFTGQLPKSCLTPLIKNLFKNDQKVYLFRSFDYGSMPGSVSLGSGGSSYMDDMACQNLIMQSLKPIFFSQAQQMQQLPQQQQANQKKL